MGPRRLACSALVAVGLTYGLLWLLSAAASSTSVAHASPGTTRYVATSGTDTVNSCTEPLTPCATIQHAVDQADSGDEVRVTAGTYTGTNSYGGLSQVVYISKTVAVRGGYTTTNWTASDPDANPTVVDAEGNGRVFYITGDISTTLEGLGITGGDATGLAVLESNTIRNNVATDGFNAYGGGVCLWETDAILRGNSIISNAGNTEKPPWDYEPESYGGGILVYGGNDVQLIDNIIRDNTASREWQGWGGGAWIGFTDRVTLTGNTIEGNRGGETYESSGGGVALYYFDEAVVADNWIVSNTACTGNELGISGGLEAWSPNSVTIDGNYIMSNTASLAGPGAGGGAGILGGLSATLRGNYILGNTASREGKGYGGGLYLGGNDFTLTNNLIAENSLGTSGYGAGIYIIYSSSRLQHNTVAHNSGGDGSGVSIYPCDHLCENNILNLRNNMIVSHMVGINVGVNNTVTMDSTLWWNNGQDWDGEGTITATNNYTGNPDFIPGLMDDFHIGPNSAALDRGVDAGVTTDIDGDIRPWFIFPDLGADEAPYTRFVNELALPLVIHK